MPDEPRYEQVDGGDPPAHSNAQEDDYFGEAVQDLPIRRRSAHAYQDTPGSESTPLTQIGGSPENGSGDPPSSPIQEDVRPGTNRQFTGNTVRSDRSSATKVGKWSIHNFSTPKIPSPWDHDLPIDHAPTRHSTERTYNYKKQRKRLFLGGVMKFLMTLSLCASFAGALIGYQMRWALPNDQKHTFNAVITGLSVALSLNLASSFRYYAQVLRWRFLASALRPLKEFDLLLSCDSQVKVFRLFWEARKRPLLQLKFLSLTQICCLIWLAVNLSAQVLVAMLGLTYNLDTSPTHLETKTGQISVADLSFIRDVNNNSESNAKPGFYQQLSAAQAYGIQAQDFDVEDISLEGNTAKNTLFWSGSYWEYVFDDLNPENPSVNIISGRFVDASAVCTSYDVVAGGLGNETTITAADADGNTMDVYVDKTSPGATTFISDTAKYCGPRCTRVMAFQAQQGDDGSLFGLDIPDATFWDCNSTVSNIQTDPGAGDTSTNLTIAAEQARIAAGAIGWTGFFYTNDTREYQMYSTDSPWSLPFTPDSDGMASLISKFAVGVFASMDDHGPRMNITGSQPSTALILTVEWKYAAALLGVIPFLQFCALLIVVAFANKVIIKDDTHLGMARLLRPVVGRLGDHGCMLTGKEISEELHMKAIYGYREPGAGSDVFHLDVLTEEDKMPLRGRRAFEEGVYDGVGGEKRVSLEDVRTPGEGLRRRKRRVSF